MASSASRRLIRRELASVARWGVLRFPRSRASGRRFARWRAIELPTPCGGPNPREPRGRGQRKVIAPLETLRVTRPAKRSTTRASDPATAVDAGHGRGADSVGSFARPWGHPSGAALRANDGETSES
jgi:hypothetical protein